MRSKPGSGTEAELTIPASLAYVKAPESKSRPLARHAVAGRHSLAWSPCAFRVEPGAGRQPVRAHTVEDPRRFIMGAIIAIAQTRTIPWLYEALASLRWRAEWHLAAAGPATSLQSSAGFRDGTL